MYLQLLKSLNRLHPRAWDFVQLSRMDRPIGIYLLLWPTLSAVWIAGQGSPTLANVLIFGLGVVLMRAAGCCINDFADRKVDGHVKRTADRPLASGRVKPREALALFATLVGVSFLLVLCTNSRTVWLSFGAVAAIALGMSARVRACTPGRLLIARSTVARESPDSRAISAIVTRPIRPNPFPTNEN